MEAQKVDARFGLVEFKDIYKDGNDSTKNYGWYTSAKKFTKKLSTLTVDGGGGDGPETPIDALENACQMKYRTGVERYIIFSTKIYKICDVYTVFESIATAGAVVIVVVVAIKATPVVLANVQALEYYCKTYGIKDGIDMYSCFGTNNLYRVLANDVRLLERFTERKWGEQYVRLTDYDSKILQIVVPKMMITQEQKAALDAVKLYASERNIEVVVTVLTTK